ncbi:MAG: Ig-like domain-containing protein [Thermoplasmatota archaeon]
MSGTITVVVLPVVHIGSPSSGQRVLGTFVALGNASHATQSISSVAVRVDRGGSTPATLVGSGTVVNWSASISTASLADGTHMLTVTATTSSGLEGTSTTSFVVANSPTIDLSAVYAQGSTSTTTTSSTIRVDIVNKGNTASGPFDTLLEYQTPSDGRWHTLAHLEFDSIKAFGTSVDVYNWNGGGTYVGQFPIRATANDLNQVAETDSPDTNNVATGDAAFVTTLVPGTTV